MEFAGVLSLDGFVGSSSNNSGGGGGGGCVLSSHFAPLENEPMTQKGLSLKHGRCNEVEDEEYWWSRSLKAARSDQSTKSAAAAAPPFNNLLRSTNNNSHSSLFPENGEQMLSFSSSSSSSTTTTTKPNASLMMMMAGNDGSSYYHYPTSYSPPPPPPPPPPPAAYFYRNPGMVSGSTNVSMHGVMAGVRGPFTPSQWMELEHQALIYKYIDAKVPIPSNLLIPLQRRSINPSGFPAAYPPGSFRSSALGWGTFHLGFSGNADPEPGRCRRTDGKKWRCSRDAVADQKYCERHMNRGRHRSRKLVEGHAGQASKLIATSQSLAASAASKGLNSNVVDPSPSQFNRILMGKEKINDHIGDSRGLSMLTSSQADFGLVSSDSVLNPSRTENITFDSTSQFETHPLRHFIDDCPKTQLSISIPTDFSSSSNSPNREKLALSPLRLSRDQFNEKEQRETSNWIPISWEQPTVGGPLGEVLTNTYNTPKGLSKNCSSSSLNLLTEGWEASSRLEASPTGVLQKTTTFGSLSSSTGSSPRADNNKPQHDSTSNM